MESQRIFQDIKKNLMNNAVALQNSQHATSQGNNNQSGGPGPGRKGGAGAARGPGPAASLDGPGPQMYPSMIQDSYGSNNDGMF